MIPVSAIVRRTRSVYAQIDPQLEKQARELGATCKKGCAGCCHQEVACTFAEAMAIAHHIYDALPRSIAHPVAAFFAESIIVKTAACPFLDKRSDDNWQGVCHIYDVRPLVCRTFFVSTPPEECNPHAPERGRLATNGAIAASAKAIAGGDATYALVGPLPQFVAHALECLIENKEPSLILLMKWSGEARAKATAQL